MLYIKTSLTSGGGFIWTCLRVFRRISSTSCITNSDPVIQVIVIALFFRLGDGNRCRRYRRADSCAIVEIAADAVVRRCCITPRSCSGVRSGAAEKRHCTLRRFPGGDFVVFAIRRRSSPFAVDGTVSPSLRESRWGCVSRGPFGCGRCERSSR